MKVLREQEEKARLEASIAESEVRKLRAEQELQRLRGGGEGGVCACLVARRPLGLGLPWVEKKL